MIKLFSIRKYSSHSYQSTLNLPKTKFPNRSNLQTTINSLIPQCCDLVYKTQYNDFLNNIKKIKSSDDKLKFIESNLFVLHDGPPYANGDLHLGHALNKILKDIINRYQLLQGKYIFYKVGWDCHGLPIELKALQKINQDFQTILPSTIRSIASKHAYKTIESQLKQFQSFGIMTDWKYPYLTMDKRYELDQLNVFQEMLHRGLIKRQRKPVYWGIETKTALAEGELEYVDNHVSHSAFVKFPLTSESLKFFYNKYPKLSHVPIKCVIWTSTPWTLFSNRAICFNDNFEYSLIDVGNEYLIIESSLADQVNLNSNHICISTMKGSNLRGIYYSNPLVGDNVARPLLHGSHVTNNTGTGLVHTAPGHGEDDYLIGLTHNLEIFSPVNYEGRYILDELPFHLRDKLLDSTTGKPRMVLDKETTKLIIQLLNEKEMLLYSYDYVHSYPYDWRSKTPVIIRSTPQWFADLHEVKSLALESLENVEFFPLRGYNRLVSFIKMRNEWCISRQRSWGVPIPYFFNKENPDEILINEEIVNHIIKTIEVKGIDSWFSLDNSDNYEWLPEKYHNIAHLYFRGKDTIDVWFDSGTSWNVLKEWYLNVIGLDKLPMKLCDVYLEGSDQHRGWFQSSLLTRVASLGKSNAPYRSVITHGFTLDENGIKMSKSIGNTILPKSIIEGDKDKKLPALGVDGLRLLVAQSNFTSDISVGPVVMKHVGESLKKFRLTFRFLLGNLQKSPDFKLLPFNQLRPLDQYTLCKLQNLSSKIKELYESYNFSKILTTVQYHMNNDLSAFYFDISKDSLYSDSIMDLKRLQIQTTLFHIFDAYRSFMSPIIPIMIQESWNHLPKEWITNNMISHKGIYDEDIPLLTLWKDLDILNGQTILKNFQDNELKILSAFQEIFNKFKPASKSVQTKTIIYCNDPLPFTKNEITDILQTGEVEFTLTTPIEPYTCVSLSNNVKVYLSVEQNRKSTCPRCWKSCSTADDILCHRCNHVVSSL